jgi:death on curing protein
VTWKFLLADEVILQHDMELEEGDGGSPGLRDRGLLESALGRPEKLAEYGDPDVVELAACYLEAVSRAHAFVDCNKRTAWLAMNLFLELNGWQLLDPPTDLWTLVEAVATGEAQRVVVQAWLRRLIVRRDE